MKSLLQIGTSERAVKATKEALLEIMTTHADQETIRCAIQAFTKSIQPRDISVSNCSFYAEPPNTADSTPRREAA